MNKINKIIEDIATTLNSYSIEDREQIFHEELDRAVIYYTTQYEIIYEFQPSSFFIGEIGEYAKTPAELAWWILYTKFYDRFGYLME